MALGRESFVKSSCAGIWYSAALVLGALESVREADQKARNAAGVGYSRAIWRASESVIRLTSKGRLIPEAANCVHTSNTTSQPKGRSNLNLSAMVRRADISDGEEPAAEKAPFLKEARRSYAFGGEEGGTSKQG